MVAYARYPATELPKAVGSDVDGRRKSDGRAGHLCHGPYITLGPGRYTAGFYVKRDPGDDEGRPPKRSPHGGHDSFMVGSVALVRGRPDALDCSPRKGARRLGERVPVGLHDPALLFEALGRVVV